MSKALKVNINRKVFIGPPVVEALGKVELEVKPQEFVSILGPSGCGKSTLLRLIVGLDTDFDGKITLGDRVVKGPEKDCSIMFQEARLLPWASVKDNVHFGLYADRENAEAEKNIADMLKLLDLEQFSNSYPLQLSGGMVQRVALARALINLPDLLLLDEPFASLDELRKRKLQDELQRILQKERTTALMVSHDIEEAIFLSDRIFIMSQRPATILKTFEVALPKPRVRTDEKFIAIYKDILGYMQDTLKLF